MMLILNLLCFINLLILIQNRLSLVLSGPTLCMNPLSYPAQLPDPTIQVQRQWPYLHTAYDSARHARDY
jgi:hypothetical protein